MDIKLFNENLPHLERLFTSEVVKKNKERVESIFDETEKNWRKNTTGLKNQKVKYLLICEAPPFSESGEPLYFYSQINTGFFTKIWNVFYPATKKPKTKEEAYSRLAEKGFLLVDSLPYAMKYSSQHRSKESYIEILKNSIPELLKSLNNGFDFDDNLKIAFGFKINAKQIIKITKGRIELSNISFEITESNIAVDAANYTNTNLLKSIYKIPSNDGVV